MRHALRVTAALAGLAALTTPSAEPAHAAINTFARRPAGPLRPAPGNARACPVRRPVFGAPCARAETVCAYVPARGPVTRRVVFTCRSEHPNQQPWWHAGEQLSRPARPVMIEGPLPPPELRA